MLTERINQGAICLDILSKRWSPAMTLKTTLLSIQSLLATPEPADPQDAQAATELINHPEAFEAKARLWAQMYAGAGVGEGSTGPGGGNGGDGVNPAVRKWRWEYPESLVRRFVEMGFEEERVVGALRRVGVERGRGEVEEGVAGRVVDELWS
ncbi:UBC-like protein [Ascodesmis nigricans]|uniref:UBC-like protein n=1 Tax=Ascodesmis nigricans TaxID=341454 RepID=A0A4S2MIS6_9PEZI|nr:UBC-like protein [Ascodesmis nigricans]